MERVEIQDETPESLMTLLDNQKLYNENPNWKDFQLPPMFQERPPQSPAQEQLRQTIPQTPFRPPPEMKPPLPEPPVQESLSPPQQLLSPARELLSQSVQESMRAQAQMVDRLAQELQDISSRMNARPQFIPAPVQPPPTSPPYQPPPALERPVVPPPGEAAGGIPRFARDFVEDEEEAGFAPFGGPAEPPKPTAEAAIPVTAAGETSLETAKAPEIRREVSPEKIAQQGPGKERRKHLRQRLKDFLKRVRERLEQRRSKLKSIAAEEPKPPAHKASTKESKRPKAKKQAAGVLPGSPPPEQSGSQAQRLMNYLEELTEYLPERRQSSFLHSDARLKIEYIKSRLQGRSGIKNQIESKFRPQVPSSSLDVGKIAETFDFMKDLASYHPDKTLGTMLQSKLNGILHKIRE